MPSACHPPHPDSRLPRFHKLGWSRLSAWPLPELSRATDRALIRLVCLVASRQVELVEAWENILPERDPFLLVANHSSCREAVFLQAILLLARGGRTVRFLADWNFRLIPGASYLYKRCGAITLTRKDGRPRILNRLRPLFETSTPPLEEARRHLLQGGSVGIFPEGTVNRNADRLKRGRRAAARLSLETGVPVIPVGIRFDRRRGLNGPIDSSSTMRIHIGEAMTPQIHTQDPVPPRAVTSWNARLMTEIGRLCAKQGDGVRQDKGKGLADIEPDLTSSPI